MPVIATSPFWALPAIAAARRWFHLAPIGNESVPIQLAQCRFPGLANSNAKNKYIFSNKTFRKQFYQTARGNCYMV